MGLHRVDDFVGEDRLVSRGMVVDRICMLCHLKDESHEQFSEYSQVGCKSSLEKNNIARPCFVLSREIE